MDDNQNETFALHICVWKPCNFSIEQVGVVENNETERTPTITFSLESSPHPPNRTIILSATQNSSVLVEGFDALGK